MKKTPVVHSAGDDASKQSLRQQAEDRLAQSSDSPETLLSDESRDILHELRVHQLELEMQNEELRKAQAEIEAGRARYFDLYDLAPVGYITLSEQGLILETNLTAIALLGTARSSLIKRPISHFIVEEDQDIYYLHRKKLFEAPSTSSGQAGEPQTYDLRLVKPDGTNFWAHLTATTAQAEDGAPVCRVALSDITERKQAESALRESGERFAQLAEQSRIVTWQVDASGLYTYVSHAVTSNLGYTPEELIGKMHFYDLHPEAGRAAFKAAALEVFARKEAFRDFENLAANKAGDPVWISTNGIPVLDENGNLAGYRGNDADITDRKRSEAALRESEERFMSVFHASKDAILLIGDHAFIDCNETTAAMLGYASREQFLRTHPSELSPETQPDGRNSREKADEIMRQALEGGFYRFEWIHVRANGEHFPVEVSLTPIVHNGRNVLYCVWRDITHNKNWVAD